MLAGSGIATQMGPGRATCAYADGASHVAVVVQHADGRVIARCVGVTGTGAQVLDASGINYATVHFGGSLGDAVCQVDGEPQTPPGGFTRDNCLGNPYWGLWAARRGGGWAPTPSGVTNTTFADGDAEGLRYGDGSSQPASPAGTCPPAASPTASTAAASPSPNPSANSNPTAGAKASGTPTAARPAPTPSTSSATDAPASPSPSAAASPARGQVALANPAAHRGAPPPAATVGMATGSRLGWGLAGGAFIALSLLLIGQVAQGRLRP